jgi:hypothetical protein
VEDVVLAAAAVFLAGFRALGKASNMHVIRHASASLIHLARRWRRDATVMLLIGCGLAVSGAILNWPQFAGRNWASPSIPACPNAGHERERGRKQETPGRSWSSITWGQRVFPHRGE